MCERCRELYEETPPEVIQKMDDLHFEFANLMNRFGQMLRDNDLIDIQNTTGEEEPKEELDMILRVVGGGFAMGWYLCANQESTEITAKLMEPMMHLFQEGCSLSHAYNYIKQEKAN